MLFNFQSNKLRKHLLVGSAVCAATLGFFGCTPDYNLDEDQPSGLNTIYGYMEDQGNYKNFLQLIDDLGEKETLSKTGSKTLFIQTMTLLRHSMLTINGVLRVMIN